MSFDQPNQYDEGTLTFKFNDGLGDLRIGAFSLIVNYTIVVLYTALELFEVTRAFITNPIMSYVFSLSILFVSVFGYFRLHSALTKLDVILKPAKCNELSLIRKLFIGYFAILIFDFILSMIFGFTSINEKITDQLFLTIFVLAFLLYAIIFLLFSLMFKELGAITGFNSRFLVAPLFLLVATITGMVGRIMVTYFSGNLWFYFNSIAYLIYALVVIGIYIEIIVTINRIDVNQTIQSLY